MKNLFIITEEEKQRILNMHQDATKRNYLSNDEQSDELINEQKFLKRMYKNLFGKKKNLLKPEEPAKKTTFTTTKEKPWIKAETTTFLDGAFNNIKKSLKARKLLDENDNLTTVLKEENLIQKLNELKDKTPNKLEKTKIQEFIKDIDPNTKIITIKKIHINDLKESFDDNVYIAYDSNSKNPKIDLPTTKDWDENDFKELINVGDIPKQKKEDLEVLSKLNLNSQNNKIINGDIKKNRLNNYELSDAVETQFKFRGRTKNTALGTVAILYFTGLLGDVINVIGWAGNIIFGNANKNLIQDLSESRNPNDIKKLLCDKRFLDLDCYGIQNDKLATTIDFNVKCNNILKTLENNTSSAKKLLDDLVSNVTSVGCINQQYKGDKCFWEVLYDKNPNFFKENVIPKINGVFDEYKVILDHFNKNEEMEKLLNSQPIFSSTTRNQQIAKRFVQNEPNLILKMSGNDIPIKILDAGNKDIEYYVLIKWDGKYYSEFGASVGVDQFDEILKNKNREAYERVFKFLFNPNNKGKNF